MGEYGRIVGEGTGVGGRGGGSGDLTSQIMGTLGDVLDQIASLPAQMQIGIVAAILIGGWLLTRR